MTDKAPRLEEFWQPRPRLRRLPFGYRLDPLDDTRMLPDSEIIPLIEEAMHQINGGVSLREAADWISANTPNGEKISHAGLKQLLGERYTNRTRVRPDAKPRPKTMAQRLEERRRARIANEKKRIQHAKKRIEKLGGQIEEIKKKEEAKKPLEGFVVEYEKLSVPQERKEKSFVIFEPNPGPQFEFIAAEEQEVLYGGAAGGGKSYAMLADPIRYFSNPNFNGLLLRRTNDELRELKWKARSLYDNHILKGRYKEKDNVWVFPSGAQLWLTFLDRDEDVQRYQGQSFTWIGVDELTQYPTPFAWNYLRSRLRSVDPTIPLSMRATSNPGGPGHGWVKRMFIDPSPPNEPFWATDIETNEVLAHPLVYAMGHPKAGQPNPKGGQPLFQRRFIPAKLYDNPYLIQDEKYESSLLSLPEDQRRQLLEGDWNVAEGAAFSEFRTHIHVCEPFKIPINWRKFRSCDYGYSSFSCVHWYAIDPEGVLYVYRELYVSKKTGPDLAKLVLEAERDEKVSYGVLDSSVWHERGTNGPTVAEEMNRLGCKWRPSDRSKGSRSAGKHRLHQLLKINPDTGKPGIIFFKNCRQIIADLPIIPTDPDGDDDIDDRFVHDHSYDSIRYGIMSRPQANSFWSIAGTTQSSHYYPSDARFGY